MTMTDAARIEIVTRGTAVIQNKSNPFATTVKASDIKARLHKVLNN